VAEQQLQTAGGPPREVLAKIDEVDAIHAADVPPAFCTLQVRSFEVNRQALADPERHIGKPDLQTRIESELMGRFMNDRRDSALRARLRENLIDSGGGVAIVGQ